MSPERVLEPGMVIEVPRPPILVSCYFTAKVEFDGQYDRLARVLEHTAERHCPEWDVQIDPIVPTLSAAASGNPSHSWNTAKLEHWCDAVATAPDGARVLLMDADTAILRPLDPLWDLEFDLAYTVRAHGRQHIPLNGGVVAVRVSALVRRAFEQWRQINRQMVTDRNLHDKWRRTYAGINQASFGALLEGGGFQGLNVLALPCEEWNCVEWHRFSAHTRVLHLKGLLRRAVFGGEQVPSGLHRLVRLWHDLEAEAKRT